MHPKAKALLQEALLLEHEGRIDGAVRAYKKLFALGTDPAEAHYNCGRLLLAQGKRREASVQFAHALAAMPQQFERYEAVLATTYAVRPSLAPAMAKASGAWPARTPMQELFAARDFDEVANDPLLLCVLELAPVRDLALERLLTSLRAAFLQKSLESGLEPKHLGFACALARQCYVNEYVFACEPQEAERVAQLFAELAQAAATGASIAPGCLAVAAMYRPLTTIAEAAELTRRRWPEALRGLLTQQIEEPAQERALRQTIPALTPIADSISAAVRGQYEENPYPRWTEPPGEVEAQPLNAYLRGLFPTTPFTPLATDAPEVLVAGCGTGWHALALARRLANLRLLAVDLSLSSLTYAKRKTPADLAGRISFAQADILALGSSERRFDVIDSSGVLHHMAVPFAGWRVLVDLLRPSGLMHIGLYSEAGRADVVAARKFIADRGFAPGDIPRCRQELIAQPWAASLIARHDFYTASECRDLLFHVQEVRLTIPQIQNFLRENGLAFIGFEFGEPAASELRSLFAANGWSMRDLDRWHRLETEQPALFSGMYQFWVQKA